MEWCVVDLEHDPDGVHTPKPVRAQPVACTKFPSLLLTRLSEQEFLQLGRCTFLHAGDHVAIGIEGHADSGVPEALLNYLGMDTLLKE